MAWLPEGNLALLNCDICRFQWSKRGQPVKVSSPVGPFNRISKENKDLPCSKPLFPPGFLTFENELGDSVDDSSSDASHWDFSLDDEEDGDLTQRPKRKSMKVDLKVPFIEPVEVSKAPEPVVIIPLPPQPTSITEEKSEGPFEYGTVTIHCQV
jgi:hypothetical protein